MRTEAPSWPPAQPGDVRRPSRAIWKRILMTLGLWVPVYAGAFILMVATIILVPASFATSDQGAKFLLFVLSASVFVAYGFLARQVSYRWFDTFSMLVPGYGLIWMFKILWRVANLPNRDWPLRPDELPTTSFGADQAAPSGGDTRAAAVQDVVEGREISDTPAVEWDPSESGWCVPEADLPAPTSASPWYPQPVAPGHSSRSIPTDGVASVQPSFAAVTPSEARAIPGDTSLNRLAVASLITSIVGLGVLGVTFGHAARRQIRRTGQRGRGIALGGLIVGYLGVAGALLGFVHDSLDPTPVQAPPPATGIVAMTCVVDVSGTVTWTGQDPALVNVAWRSSSGLSTAGQYKVDSHQRWGNVYGEVAPETPDDGSSWVAFTVTLFDRDGGAIDTRTATCFQ